MKTKKIIKKILIIVINIVLVLLMLFFILISPYRYEWAGEQMKQIDDDTLDFLIIIWVLFAIIIPVFALFSKPAKKIYYLWYAALMFVVIFRLLYLTIFLEA